MKYKVGDRVVVRSDLQVGKTYCMADGITRDGFVDNMERFRGHVVTIRCVDSKYRISEYGYNWTDEMFEGLVDEMEVDVMDLI